MSRARDRSAWAHSLEHTLGDCPMNLANAPDRPAQLLEAKLRERAKLVGLLGWPRDLARGRRRGR
jgi:hypothetical protein